MIPEGNGKDPDERQFEGKAHQGGDKYNPQNGAAVMPGHLHVLIPS
jgi:hypothetical protein